MKIILTGACGFIGYHVTRKLIKNNHEVIGIDNLNTYYDVKLKKKRLALLKKFNKFKFYKENIENYNSIEKIFKKHKPTIVVNLAAQAGVRYSLKNPKAYINTNILGFFNVLDISKKFKIKNFVYASSSSVYGANKNLPFSEKKMADHPIQLYAATKRSNEIMAHAYSSLYNMPTVGLRFFTAYGPWGRPDQALYIFTKNILENKKVNLFNNGNHSRDFTYVDDIVNGIYLCVKNPSKQNKFWNPKNPEACSSKANFKIYNIGSNTKTNLKKYLNLLEKYLGKKAKIKYLPLQKGDVVHVSSKIENIKKDLGYKPTTSVEVGVKKFVNWFKDYHQIK